MSEVTTRRRMSGEGNSANSTRDHVDRRRRNGSTLVGIAFVLCVGALAHFLFSAHGFSPTDEGYYLSNARRVLDGEVPHRDFITLRPAGAYFMFLPVVALAGDSTLWAARLTVLMELATVAWLWALMIHRHMGEPFGRRLPVASAAVSFMLTLGWYPIEVTTTIEGYFWFTVGLAFAVGGGPARKTVGYLLMGYAYLCRQNLLFAGAMALLFLGDWRRLRYWVAGGLPGMVYVGWLAGAGGLRDFVAQLGAPSTNNSSQGGFIAIGVVHWLREPLLWGGVVGGVVAGVMLTTHQFPSLLGRSRRSVLGAALVAAVTLGGSAFTLRYGHAARVLDFRWYSFAVTGTLAGLLAAIWASRLQQPLGARLVLCGLAMAWALSFSWGAPAPTLGLGPMVLLALALAVNNVEALRAARARDRMGIALAILTIPLAGILYQARQFRIALDPPVSQQTRRLDGVFAGGRHLLTDSNTYAYLLDFKDALRQARAGDVVVGPDLGAYWIRAPRRNPVSINWLFYGELINASLEQRILRELYSKRGTYTYIASKVMASEAADGFRPVPSSWSPVQDSVRAHFTKVGQTRYFELYR